MNDHIRRLKIKDFSKILDLIAIFLPTGDLQEIPLSSGWADDFLNISEKFDNVIKDIIEEFQLDITYE